MLLMACTQVGNDRIHEAATNGLVFHVSEVVYGSGGFNPGSPATATALDINATSLSNEVFRQAVPIDHTTRDEISGFRGKETTYTSLGGDEYQGIVGEALLIAEVTASGGTSHPVGTKFPLMVAHFSREILGEEDRLAIQWKLDYFYT